MTTGLSKTFPFMSLLILLPLAWCQTQDACSSFTSCFDCTATGLEQGVNACGWCSHGDLTGHCEIGYPLGPKNGTSLCAPARQLNNTWVWYSDRCEEHLPSEELLMFLLVAIPVVVGVVLVTCLICVGYRKRLVLSTRARKAYLMGPSVPEHESFDRDSDDSD
uniref:PSI domain-containing protein n=1 Tax=Palpitomonas bilix TaxID=652834 RepID=A0A7S3GD68_9EUKA|mmetsp:Transcript_44330/g.115220  ORF Transcript_44330/g.115220 Transcript_44330/m.115220 type:complete len:163 (+) Transcript_44330:153-641(+)